ncbi:MAG: hypothetical protein CBC13_04510 [Planctomycetia bacterium TMED53]|nr:MAG: hypothetical protein CBC13_04510 [Planctomycetia bacterium TMED53]
MIQQKKPLHSCLHLLVFALVGFGCTKELAPPSNSTSSKLIELESPAFRVLDASSGFTFEHSFGDERRYWIPETITGGGALFDYDGDGDLDIYCVQAGGDCGGDRSNAPPNQLFRNEGNLTFTNVTEIAGVGDRQYGLGACCADVDGDGDIDLFVCNRGPDILYLNNGDGTFTEAAENPGFSKDGVTASAAFRDLDGDGLPELYATQYIQWSPEKELKCGTGLGQDYCAPANYNAPAPDRLFKNLGGGRFKDISEEAGLRSSYGNGLGVVIGDFNLDGAADIYVANDGSPNQLWIQQGDLRFVDKAVETGCAVNMMGVAEAGMGVQAADVDADGDLDLFMTHIRNETNTWYRNDGGIFTDATISTGLARYSRDSTGFGMGYFDFDHDGLLDLYVANGKVIRTQASTPGVDPYAEPDQLFKGAPNSRFVEVKPTGGWQQTSPHTSRGAAFGDLDSDGDIDILVFNCGGPATLLINEHAAPNSSVVLRLVDQRGIDAEGGRVTAKIGDQKIHRVATRHYSYCVSNSPELHIGLGSAALLSDIRVHWPNGDISEHADISAGSRVTITQP